MIVVRWVVRVCICAFGCLRMGIFGELVREGVSEYLIYVQRVLSGL